MAQVGKNEAKPFNDLQKIVNELLMAARMLSNLWARRRGGHISSEKQYEQETAKLDKYEAIFWEGLEEDDPINQKIEATIQCIEKTCQNIISGKGTLHHFLNKDILKKG